MIVWSIRDQLPLIFEVIDSKIDIQQNPWPKVMKILEKRVPNDFIHVSRLT